MQLFFAAGTAPAFFTDAVMLIVAGAIIAYISYRFGLVPIVGFLLAGVVIGPNGIRLVSDRALVDAAAEVGVILLLFTIGIEFSLDKLARIKRLIFVGGSLQVGLTTALTAGALMLFGVGWQAAIFTGMLVALSSTAIVLKLLSDRGETNAEHGQVALGLLIFQDLAIVVMVLLVPLLGTSPERESANSTFDIIFALAKAGAIILAVLLFARRLMPRILELVARTCSPELFLLTVIAVCFGTAYLTSLAGVSLSLGAFLAGLLVSESRFSEHALGEIMPLQILFSATFFVSVGMLLDLGFLISNLPLVVAGVVGVLLTKALATGISVRALRYPLPIAGWTGLMLAQVGEFSFVLERAGREFGLSPAGLGESGSQTFIAATVVLMVFTPQLTQLGALLAGGVEKKRATRQAQSLERAARDDAPPATEVNGHGELSSKENHVVVAGYGHAARSLVRVLMKAGVPFVITTLSPQGANEADAEGLPVLRGDASRGRTLQLAGIEQAKMLVIADDEPSVAARIVAVARTLNPTMRILVRTRYLSEVETLKAAGADRVVAEELESIIGMFGDVLRDYRIVPSEIERHEETVRQGGYALLRRTEVRDGEDRGAEPKLDCEFDIDCGSTRTVTIHRGAAILSRTIGAATLDELYSLRLIEMRREGKILKNVSEDLSLLPGDELVLSGSVSAFQASAELFESRDAAGKENSDERALNRFNRERMSAYQIDTEREIPFVIADEAAACAHSAEAHSVVPSARGCEECLQTGDTWVHLRICMTCGHVGCCDSSKNRHATKHFDQAAHPIMKSLEPGEDWAWCYIDRKLLPTI